MKGQKISDRYQIIKNIGEGGMSNVFLAHDTILDREVAVKVLRGDLATDEKFVRRFQREALAASSLSNPNIVEIYDVGEDSGEYYIVMEYIEGKHLKNLLKKRGKLTIPEVVDIGLQITHGLSIAHDSYLIHRDIKPQNILILENGLVKITDFGIAIAMNGTQLTQTNSVMGSVHYLPPEQAMGKTSTLQSDIYSIGIVLYELLAGKLPYTGENAVEIALKHLKESMPEINAQVPNIPQSIANIIIRATAKNPKNRYSDAREMHEDLKTCLDESRKKEAKIVLKYPETDYDETKVMKIVNQEKEEKKIEEKNKKKEDEEVIAKKITEKDLKGNNKTLLIMAGIFTGLVVIITTLVVLIPKIASSDIVVIPDVAGLTEKEAIELLQDAGFVVDKNIIYQQSKDHEDGVAVKTAPFAGSERKIDSSVTLYMSLGNTDLIMQDYIGMDVAAAEALLKNLKFNVIINYQDVDLSTGITYEPDVVIDQSVKEGEELSPNSTVILYLPRLEVYPDFLAEEYTEQDVRDFALEWGLNLKVNYVTSDLYQEGAVIDQNRNVGDPIYEGSSLTIDVVGTSTLPVDPDDEPDCGVGEDGKPLC